jgi:hypothetical protein
LETSKTFFCAAEFFAGDWLEFCLVADGLDAMVSMKLKIATANRFHAENRERAAEVMAILHEIPHEQRHSADQ